jgi:hypothetical protein
MMDMTRIQCVQWMRTNCHQGQVTSLPFAQLASLPLLRVPRSPNMDSDVVCYDMAVGEDVAIFCINHEGTANG